ncbi:MAG: hypothetical protein QNJ13_06050 [Paracoccaceae bacterium]|nr:hypothetical protein [Paracoccaceae bacterium]
MGRFRFAVLAIRRIARSPVVLAALLLSLVFAVAGMVFVERSFLVEAETSYAELAFGGDANTWNFPKATVCNPLETPDFTATGSGQDAAPPVCNPMLFETPVEAGGEVTLTWSCGARVSVQSDVDGALVVSVLEPAPEEDRAERCEREPSVPADAHGIVPGSVIVVADADWRATGALPFQAAATLGEDIGPGSVHYLQSGRWEARQTSPVYDYIPLHRITEVVKSGSFSLGAEVQVTDFRLGRPALVWGHITPTAEDFDNSLAGFSVVMVSAPGKTELRLAHFGLREPATIRPDWVDTAITSPLFLAVFAILNLIAVILQILNDASGLRRGEASGGGSGDAAIAKAEPRAGEGPHPVPPRPPDGGGPSGQKGAGEKPDRDTPGPQ